MTTIIDSPHSRWSFLNRVHNLRLIIMDLQSDISRALATQPAHDTLLVLVEADTRLQVTLIELDVIAATITKLGGTP